MLTDSDIDRLDKRFEAKFATKGDLVAMEKRFEAKFASKDDLRIMEKRLGKKFVTKKYFDLRLKKLTGDILGYTNQELEMFRSDFEDFKKEMLEFKETTMRNIDWLVGAFKKFDDEHTILTANYSEVRQRVDGHENRLITLEKKGG